MSIISGKSCSHYMRIKATSLCKLEEQENLYIVYTTKTLSILSVCKMRDCLETLNWL